MNYKTGLEDFIGKESLSKTLRNALIPTESTKIHMEEMGVIRDDELRAEKQQELKEIMDDYYRTFIEEKLGQIQGIQWNSLFQKMEETMEDISVRKDLDKIQNEKRKEICCYFTSDKRFKDLFNAKLITDILPNFIKDNKEYTEEEKAEKEQTRVLFQRFATAFTNYFNQRRNNFSEDNISTAISFRIVNENSEIHLQNMRAFQRIEQQYPEEVCGMEEEYKEYAAEYKERIFDSDYTDETFETEKITLVSNPIHTGAKEPVVWYTLGELMKNAKERVKIHTPYIICNEMMYNTWADVTKNVSEFSVMTNSAANNGNPFGSADYAVNRDKIVDTGIDIWEYEGGFSYHGKSILIDDNLSVIGSFNMDMRSAYLDTELMLVIRSSEINKQLEEGMMTYEKMSRQVLEDGTYNNPYHVEPIALTKKKQIKIFLVQHLLGWVRFLF